MDEASTSVLADKPPRPSSKRAQYARQPTLLASKIRRPASPKGATSRPRLLPDEQELTSTRLFVLKALAGFGKTTLLRQYGAAIEKLGHGAAWLRLDASDNAEAKVLAYLVAAFAELDPELGARLAAPMSAIPPLAHEDILAELIAYLEMRSGHTFLLLDDYHTMTSEAVHRLVWFFLRNLPANVHVVIATRHLPPWPLQEIIDDGGVRLFEEAEIRFQEQEIATYIESTHGLTLDVERLRSIHQQTDGWITAIKLVTHAGARRGAAGFPVTATTAAHPNLISYLASAVFDRLEWSTQEFLLLTSPLERLSASLCDAVTGNNTARAMLDRLLRENLFIEPLDEQGVWYRYHSIFADFLLDRLSKHPELQKHVVHRRASYWFEVNRQPHSAAEHALAAGDPERHEALIETAILDLVRGSHVALALSWFESLPTEFSGSKPDVLIPMAWCNIYLKRSDAARTLLDRASLVLNESPESLSATDQARRREFLTEIEIAEMDLAHRSSGRVPDMRRLHALKETLHSDWYFLRGYVELLASHAHLADDNLADAFAAAADAVVYAKKVPNAFTANLALEQLAQVRFLQGRLQDAETICLSAIGMAFGATGQPLPVASHFHLLLAKIYYERNDLELSRSHLQSVNQLTSSSSSPAMLTASEILAAKHLALVQGERAALGRLIEYNNERLDRSSPQSIALVRAHEAWFYGSVADLKAAEGILRQAEAPLSRAQPPTGLRVNPLQEFEQLAFARHLILTDRAEAAVNWLRHLLRLAERADRLGSCVVINGLLALAQASRGQTDSALRYVREMLSLGEQGGFGRTIVDLGPQLVRLLSEFQTRLADAPAAERTDYLRGLLAIARGAGLTLDPSRGAQAHRQSRAPAPGEDWEALTPREAQILEMVSAGRRNREVADELLIAESSVRWHVRNVYAKLGVHNRTEASAKGRALRLIH